MTFREEIEHFLTKYADKFARVNEAPPELKDFVAQLARIVSNTVTRLEERQASVEANLDGAMNSAPKVASMDDRLTNIEQRLVEWERRHSELKGIESRVSNTEARLDFAKVRRIA